MYSSLNVGCGFVLNQFLIAHATPEMKKNVTYNVVPIPKRPS